MKHDETKHEITEEVRQAARQNPGGWVYKIDGAFGPTEPVPPEAIVGAWKVDDRGSLTGEFRPNPKYRSGVAKPGAFAFTPLNDLEAALSEARAGRLPEQKLLHALANAELAVPSAAELDAADGSGFQPLVFPKDDLQLLACFSDESRIGDYAKLAPHTLKIRGRDLLRLVPEGFGLVVNPGSAAAFDISPNGIAEMLQDLS